MAASLRPGHLVFSLLPLPLPELSRSKFLGGAEGPEVSRSKFLGGPRHARAWFCQLRRRCAQKLAKFFRLGIGPEPSFLGRAKFFEVAAWAEPRRNQVFAELGKAGLRPS